MVAPQQYNQAPLKEQIHLGCQAPVNPPAMTNGSIRLSFHCMAQSITTHSQAITTEFQAMKLKKIGRLDPVCTKMLLQWLLT